MQIIELEGAPNFRDLGGRPTLEGGTVRNGEVYRSGRLPDLTDADLAALSDLGIRTVVSLLTTDDVAEYGDDRVPEGVEVVSLPVDSETASELADRARAALSTGDFSEMPPEMNARIHRLLVDEGAGPYGELMRLIADPEARPIVFHCSHGVHRTGTAAAILLSLLGVGWDDVRDDYLASNVARAAQVQQRLRAIRAGIASRTGVDPEDVDMTNIEAFMVQDGSYIDASRDRVIAEYGSFEAYASEAMGVDDDTLDSLRSQLVT